MAGNNNEKMATLLETGLNFLGSEKAGNLTKLYSSLIDKIKRKSRLTRIGVEILNNVIGFLFDPEEGFALLSRCVLNFASFIDEKLGWEGDIPKDVRPKKDALEECLENMKELIDKM